MQLKLVFVCIYTKCRVRLSEPSSLCCLIFMHQNKKNFAHTHKHQFYIHQDSSLECPTLNMFKQCENLLHAFRVCSFSCRVVIAIHSTFQWRKIKVFMQPWLMLPFTRIQYIKYILKCVETVCLGHTASTQKLWVHTVPNPNDELHIICIAKLTRCHNFRISFHFHSTTHFFVFFVFAFTLSLWVLRIAIFFILNALSSRNKYRNILHTQSELWTVSLNNIKC